MIGILKVSLRKEFDPLLSSAYHIGNCKGGLLSSRQSCCTEGEVYLKLHELCLSSSRYHTFVNLPVAIRSLAPATFMSNSISLAP